MDAPVIEREPRQLVVTPPPPLHEEDEEREIAAGRALARRARNRTRLRWALMLLGIAVVAIGSGAFWLTGGRYASTDDAYVRAAEVSVSTDVSGLVEEVGVKEGQTVAEGQVLFRVDPRQYQIALDNAKAALANTALAINSMKDDYQTSLKNIAAQEAVVQNDQLTFDRYSILGKNNLTITRATLDQTRLQLQSDQAKLEALRKQAESQLARLGGNADIATEQHPQYLQAKAQVDEAQRQLDHTTARSPFAGVVTRVDSLQPGVFLVADTAGLTNQGAVALVSTSDLWVEANLKETDLTYVQPGNPVDVTVDAYPGIVWKGKVASISPASASDFSLLPAQNASGNWVKVVQRVPVRIAIEQDPSKPVLRSGMSVVVEIDTGHRRSLADIF